MAVVSNAPIEKNKTSVLELIRTMGHEQVAFFNDEASGLKAIVAVHNTILGPALGGTRFWKYDSDDAAIVDALRLSRGMTYKAAITGLNLGGGKAVIIGDARKDKSEALFRRYGKFVQGLSGKYITAEDVGTNTRDMEWIRLETDYVTGVPEYMGGSGDPSPFTAYGTYLSIKASAKEVFGNDSLKGKKVLVQGVGNVGSHLVDHLMKEGAVVSINDIYEDRVSAVTTKHKVSVVKTDAIFDADVDVYAPCALGATVNDDSIDKLRCSIICGAANNQLADETIHGQMLIDKGILYAPDFAVNAGGLINVAAELATYNKEKVNADCEKIYDRILSIFQYAKDKSIPTYKAANEMAEARLNSIANLHARR